MASDIDVINLALSNLRSGSINSLTEGSLQAQVAKLKYPFMRDRLLKEIPWQFNRKLKPLSLLTIDLFNWVNTYQYPVDCLKIHRLVPAWERLPAGSVDVVSRRLDPEVRSLKSLRQGVPYEVFNVDNVKVIGADDIELRVDYAAKITDPNLFSDDAILALSHLLAAEMAIPLIGAETGRQLRSDEMTLYQAYLDSAIADDMNDGYHTPPESEFITVRG
jgi:hypothetical protein